MKKQSVLIVIILIITVMAASVTTQQQQQPHPDLITELPLLEDGPPLAEQPPQYSGYLSVNPTSHDSLFYWLFTCNCTVDANTPLIIWLNGMLFTLHTLIAY